MPSSRYRRRSISNRWRHAAAAAWEAEEPTPPHATASCACLSSPTATSSARMRSTLTSGSPRTPHARSAAPPSRSHPRSHFSSLSFLFCRRGGAAAGGGVRPEQVERRRRQTSAAAKLRRRTSSGSGRGRSRGAGEQRRVRCRRHNRSRARRLVPALLLLAHAEAASYRAPRCDVPKPSSSPSAGEPRRAPPVARVISPRTVLTSRPPLRRPFSRVAAPPHRPLPAALSHLASPVAGPYVDKTGKEREEEGRKERKEIMLTWSP